MGQEMRVKVELNHGHIYASDLPVIALAMAQAGAKKINRHLTDDFLDGALVGILLTFATVGLAIYNAF